METALTKSPEETHTLAMSFVEKHFLQSSLQLSTKNYQLKTAPVLCLHGDLGSGKTTFMKGVGDAFGVKETIASPTFVIEKVYKLSSGLPFEHLVHIDAYRLSGGDELMHLGFDDMLNDPRNLVCIEWPENIADVLPQQRITVRFTPIDEHTRSIAFDVIHES